MTSVIRLLIKNAQMGEEVPLVPINAIEGPTAHKTQLKSQDRFGSTTGNRTKLGQDEFLSAEPDGLLSR